MVRLIRSRSAQFFCLGSVLLGASRMAHATLIYGITNDLTLISWDSLTPGTVLTGVALNSPDGSVESREILRGMDWRFPENQMYAMTMRGSSSRLYRLNVTNGQLLDSGGFGPFYGPSYGMDFITDGLSPLGQVVTSTGLSAGFSVNGGMTPRPDVRYISGDPNADRDADIVHIAYDHLSEPRLFGIDAGNDVLALINPLTGAMTTVGPLGVDATEWGGFDIASDGIAYATLGTTGASHSTFYTINLGTGHATPVDQVGGGLVINAMAVVPEPATAVLLALGALAMRRR